MVGVVIVIVGTVVSGGVYVTVTVSVPVFPAASRAVTVMMFAPACNATSADQDSVPDAVPFPPRSFDHVTAVTAALSDAVPAIASGVVVVPWVGDVVGVVIVIVGTVVSGGVYVIVMVSEAIFPAASRAVTVMTFAPGCSPTAADQAIASDAVPFPPRSFVHVTAVTPTLSDAVPPIATGVVVVLRVGADVGAVIATVGPVVSGAESTRRLQSPLDQVLSASVTPIQK